MPLPALPVLGAVAQFVARKGATDAVKKYGPKAVKKAQEQIAKREAAIKNKTMFSRTPSSKSSQSRSAETNKVKARQKRLEEERMDRDYFDIDGDPLDEVPLRFDMKAGGLLTDDRNMYKDGGPGIEALRKEAPEVVERMGYEEGGEIDNQMLMVMSPPMKSEMESKMPMESDDDMEDGYTRFIMEEALSEEEEDMLTSKLEQDEELSMLFDKIIDVAQEFAGSGPVEGPGSGVSDSIPARLSDGEFVFTAKAVEEIGEDSLMSMMKEAEAAADERQQLANGGSPMAREEKVMVAPQEPIQQNINVTKTTLDSNSVMPMQDENTVSKAVKENMMLDPYQRHVRS
ncbi:hypothetical protein OAF13_00250 [Akkermansiaceae bacterium]|nr:hypothetical protein [Akkermansiaceae bacterium]